jgi:hypothetical protein
MDSEKYSFKTYRIINIIIAGVIIGIFLYSGVFNYKKNNFPIHSFHENITGQTSISSGLSRSFSAIVRLDFEEAKAYNQYGMGLFVFFILQLLLRCFFYFIIAKSFYSVGQIIKIDVLISISLFVLYFKPFIIDCFRF